MIKTLLSIIAICSAILAITLGSQGCATVVPPAGGFKDTLPPQLIDVTPGDSTRNFSSNRVVLSFDENVDIDAASQSVIVSPVPKLTPLITRKLNVVSVRLRDSLEENTTYTINFGKTIKDLNEGNVLKDFTYVFSTGPAIDSLELHGKVLLAETGEIDTTLTVILHNSSSDSAIKKERPRYIAKLDTRGNFTFRFLPADTFYIYALADKNGLHQYYEKDLFAFSDSAIIVRAQTPPVTLYAYAPPPVQASVSTAATTTKPTAADKRLKLQTSLTENKQDLLDSFTLFFERPLKQFDSTKARLSFDSTYTPLTDYRWHLDSTKRKASLVYAWKPNVSYHISLEKDFATDSVGHQLLKSDTLDFKSRALEDYGKLSIRFRNLDLTKNPVLLFYQNDVLKSSFPLTGITLTQGMFLPGEYDMRILYDRNKNGKWDPGSFFVDKRQPELVSPIQRKITVRPNWSNEFEIDVATSTGPKIPVKEQPAQPNNRGRRF